MGQLAFAATTSHVSAIIRNRETAPEQSERLYTHGWNALAADLREHPLDALIVVATDHYENFLLENYPTFCLGVADSFNSSGDVQPVRQLRGAGSIADQLAGYLVRSGFDISVSREMRLDHSFLVPLVAITPELTTPVIPLFVNCNTPPLPTLERCFQLGQAIARGIEAMSGDAEVGIVGTGGISHWVGLPRFGQINDAWDRRFLQLVESGQIEEVFGWPDEAIVKEAGNGALEVRTWLTAIGAAGNLGGEVLDYEPMHAWATGVGIVRLRRDGARTAATSSAPAGVAV